MHTHRTIFERPVSGRLVKQRLANSLFGQFTTVPMKGPLRYVLEQITQSGALVKGGLDTIR